MVVRKKLKKGIKLFLKKSGGGKEKDNPTKKAINGTKDFETFYNKSIKKLIKIPIKSWGTKMQRKV